MNQQLYISLFIGLAMILFASGCSDETPATGATKPDSTIVEGIFIEIATRDGDTEEGDGEGAGDNNEGEEDDEEEKWIDEDANLTDEEKIAKYAIVTPRFDENTVIFLSQYGSRTTPFQSDDLIYDYKYYENPDANWDKGYNFTPNDYLNPLEWFKIGNSGTYFSSFWLFALYFPERNTLPLREENGMKLFSVERDQSTIENLKKSDVLGAYHSTQELFNRLRFKMYHLMTYLRIRLYVPVYDEETKTGYYDDALVLAQLNNVTSDFAIEWSYLRFSDEAGPQLSALSGTDNIIMYQHPLENGATSREPVRIPYREYIPQGYFDQHIKGDYDWVRVYDFSVLMPVQKGIIDEDGNEIQFNMTDFLTFEFKSNAGAQKLYTFNATNTNGQNNNVLNLTQGTFQMLELYVPRVGNQVIYLGSTLHGWKQYTSSFPMQQQKEEEVD